MRTKHHSLLMVIVLLSMTISVFAQTVPLVFDVENRGQTCQVSPGQLSNDPDLPDPFEFTNGGRVSTFEDWTCRRNEIRADIERYEIGTRPGRPSELLATYANGRLTITMRESGRTMTLTSQFTVPAGAGPHPIVIGMNSGTGNLSASLFSGVAQVPFNHDQVAVYNMTGSKSLSAPFYQFYPAFNQVGDYAAWSWGVSRLIDGLAIVAPQLNLDMSRIAVTGCSYAGKMALFAGAFDERIALTIAQESGGGGINSWRLSQDFVTRTGTNVEKIDNTNGSWFMQSMLSLNPYHLPHDHHELIAMIAPRAFLAFGNPPYEWLGDESGYKSCMAALEVWKAMGVEERFGFDFASGHTHCVASESQNNAATAFINKFLRGQTNVNTTIRRNPAQSGFDLNYTSKIKWTTPTITFGPPMPIVKITSPTGTDERFAAPTSITIEATATKTEGSITSVTFYHGNSLLGVDNSFPYSFDWHNVPAGEHIIIAVAIDELGNIATDSVKIKVNVQQGPYGGTPNQIPGIIQAEHFDVGGNGFAYYDDTPGSETGVNYRVDEDVDVEICTDEGGGYNIGWATADEWLEYTVQVKATGTYDLDLRVACEGTGRTLSVAMDGEDVATALAIPNTGGWQTWTTVTVKDIPLRSGEQVMRITIGATSYVNINYLEFFPGVITSNISRSNTGLSLLPNPFSSDGFRILHAGNLHYRITDMSGSEIEKGSGSNELHVGKNLKPGIYFIRVESSVGTSSHKIIKL